ncbi:MAG TPA: EI24 domain-containing protein [Actinocatenispora sp.]
MTAPVRAAPPAGNPVREFLDGVVLLLRGLGMWVRSPRLMALGALPALIAFVLLAGAYVALAIWINDVVGVLTPFADGWTSGWRTSAHVVVGIAVLGGGLLVAVLTFTALTLAIGDPCYEAISRRVEQRYGGVPGEIDVPWYASLGRSVKDALRMVLVSLLSGLVLFAAGFLPVVGQTVVPVLGALVGGWFLTVELTGVPFERRGLYLRERRRLLRRRRPLAVGFGVGVFLLFLIPLGAVLVTPAAVAGASLLARRVLGQPVTEAEAITAGPPPLRTPGGHGA